MSKERKRDERPPAAAGKEKDSRLGLSLVQSLRCADASLQLLFGCGGSGGFCSGVGVFLGEAFDAARGVQKLLLSGKERVAVEQISTFNRSPFMVERVWKLFPHAQWTVNGVIVG